MKDVPLLACCCPAARIEVFRQEQAAMPQEDGNAAGRCENRGGLQQLTDPGSAHACKHRRPGAWRPWRSLLCLWRLETVPYLPNKGMEAVAEPAVETRDCPVPNK
ncbi:hypothetical protein Bbelb_340050 [Branchiostoma belcheri]|nr:hypothetical protein Bbelb_340050 [Branchiostoma belcheri]